MQPKFTSASFVIPCTAHQAGIAQRALILASGDQQCAQVSAALDSEELTRSAVQSIIRSLVQNHPHQDNELSSNYLGWRFETENVKEGVRVFGDRVDLEAAVVFTQAVLDGFGITDVVAVEATTFSASNDSNEISSGSRAVLVSRFGSSWCDPAKFVSDAVAAYKQGVRFFFVTITEKIEGSEYPSDMVMRCDAGIDPDVIVAEMAAAHRSGYTDDDEEIASEIPENITVSKREIFHSEYEILKKFLA